MEKNTKLSRRGTGIMRIQKLFLILIVILIIGIVSVSSDENCPNCPSEDTPEEPQEKQLEPITITPNGPKETGEFFGLEQDRVKVRALTEDSKQEVIIEQLEDNRRKVSGAGDFSVIFYDEQGKELKKYSGFQGEFNTLVFDENNELTGGTKVIAGETKDEEGNKVPGTQVPLGAQKHYVPKGGELLINQEEDGSKKISITPGNKEAEHNIIKIPEQSEINPKTIPNGEIPEDFETIVEYKANDNTNFIDEHENKIDVDGSLYYKGDRKGGNFYYKKESSLKIGKVGFLKKDEIGEWTLITTDFSKIPEDYKGAWAVLDFQNKVLGVGTNTQEDSPILNIPEENSFVNLRMKDEFVRFLALQATGGEERSGIMVIGKQGDIATLKMYGMGAKADVDDKHLSIKLNPRTNKYDLLLNIKNAKLNPELGDKTLTFPMKVEFYKSDGETPLADHNLDLYMNGFRQFATLPKDVNWEEEEFLYKTQGSFSISPRLKYNYLHPDEQTLFNKLIQEKGKNWEFFEESDFFEKTPGQQKEFLEQFFQQPDPEAEKQPAPEKEIKGTYISDASAQNLRSVSVRMIMNTGRACYKCGKIHSAMGSGTVIGIGKDKEGKKHAIILTAAHCITRNLAVDFLSIGKRVPAKVIDYLGGSRQGIDVALVMAPIDQNIPIAKVAPKGYPLKVGQKAISVGCDRGGPCQVIPTQISRDSQYTHTPDIPKTGRSGGGLFDANSRIIGVCSLAGGGGGSYSSLQTIHQILDKNGLSRLYQFILIFANTFINYLFVIVIWQKRGRQPSLS
jgi:hypothetical protein